MHHANTTRWERLKELLSSPFWRVGLLTIGGFFLYGAWAFGVNLSHGLSTALWAGGAQGTSSAISTVGISTLIEFCYARMGSTRPGLLLTWLLPPTCTSIMHALFQWSVSTPNIILTILPSVVLGYLFAGLYVRGIIGLSKGKSD